MTLTQKTREGLCSPKYVDVYLAVYKLMFAHNSLKEALKSSAYI